jgi:UDP-N-acetylmuramoyl-tripeptide--D-alanyl-D-alanine ligase
MTDYTYLREMSKGIPKVITYGTCEAGITGRITRNEPFLEVEITGGLEKINILTKLVGEYNLPNILAAACVGNTFGVKAEKIKSAIENYQPSNSRSQLITIGSNKIILDAYNANPTSLRAAIENFAHLKADNKILILGGMAELGQDSRKEHEGIIDLIKQYPWKEVALVGGDFLSVDSPFKKFENAEAAANWYDDQRFGNSYFLIKGSRSMQMEKVLGKAGSN